MIKGEKLCVLYASKFHLSIILLEHILKNRKYEVITFLQNDLKKEINLITKLTNRYDEIINKKIDNKIENKSGNIMIIIEGDDNFIRESKKKIEKEVNENQNLKSVQIILAINYQNDKAIEEISTKNYSILTTFDKKPLTDWR